MSIFDLLQSLERQTGKAFVLSQKPDISLVSFFDRLQEVDTSLEGVVTIRTGPYINIDIEVASWNRFLQTPFTYPTLPKKPGLFWFDYFSPNIAKQLHIGHVRNVNTGIALENLLRLRYEHVVTDTHLGDWGVQFGVLLWAIKQLGNAQSFTVTIAEQPLLVETNLKNSEPSTYYTYLYVWGNQQKEHFESFDTQVREEFLALTEGDTWALATWEQIVAECSLANKKEIELLGMRPHDYILGESTYEAETQTLVTFLEEAGLAHKNGKALYIDFSKINEEELDTALQSTLRSVVGGKDTDHELGRGYLISSTGYSTYLCRDLAARIVWARDYGASECLTLTDYAQNHAFNQLKLTCSWLASQASFETRYGESVVAMFKNKVGHLGYGRVVLKSGKMSTRKGNFVTAQDVLETTIVEAKKVLLEKNPEISPEELETKARIVTGAAIKWNDLKSTLQQDSTFDLQQLLSFEGNTGVYQLYTYARLQSILKRLAFEQQVEISNVGVLQPNELELARLVYILPYVIEDTVEKREPHRLSNALYTLTQKINRWYATTSVISEGNPARKAVLWQLLLRITEAHKLGLDLLGIETLDSL